VATIQRSFSTGGAPRVFVIGGVSQLESPQAGWFGVHGAWIGGWGFSASRDLPGLGPPGVWGAERAELYPRTANRQAPGRWLSAAISFPDATGRENGLPAVGATTWRHEHAGRELVTTVLPLLEQRDHPLGEAVLMDLVRWLAEA
jgi:hypothetical protein